MSKSGAIASGAGAREFFETSLPAAATVTGPFNNAGAQLLFYNQSYESSGGGHNHPAKGGTNGNANAFTIESIAGAAKKGSAGDFFSNELFYRVSMMKAQLNSTVKTGHVSIPAPQYTSGAGQLTMKNIVEEAEQFIIDSLPSL